MTSMQLMEKEIFSLQDAIRKEKQKFDEIVDLFKKAETYVVEKEMGGTVKNYYYFIYPFKGFTLVNHGLYKIVAEYLAKLVPKNTEVLMTVEADGIGIATLMAAELDLPLVICKPFHYNTPSLEFEQQTGYYIRKMYMPKIIEGKKIGIVDCLISTGGTVNNMITAAESLPNTEVTGIYCVNNKLNYQENPWPKDSFVNKPYNYLFDIKIKDDGTLDSSISSHLRRIFWHHIDVRFYQIAEKFSQFSNVSKNGYQVGCVIVDADSFEIAAWGYRRGNVHAEQDALSMLRNNYPGWQSRKYTLYSTLEPCTFRNGYGYTPCAELISAVPQIKWVVIGGIDSAEEKINGTGVEKLVQNGKNIRLFESNKVFLAKQ